MLIYVCMPRINIWISDHNLNLIEEKRGKMPRSPFLVQGVLGGEPGGVAKTTEQGVVSAEVGGLEPPAKKEWKPYVPFYEKKGK